MKPNNIMLAGVLGLGLVSAAHAVDGKLAITGLVTDTACVVTGAGTDIPVSLGTVNRAAFTADGAPVANLGFDIAVTNCAQNSAVVVRFNGTQLPGSAGLIQLNPITDSATGVAIGLYEESGAPIPLNTNSLPQQTDGTGAALLKYTAAYVAPSAAAVVSGNVSATADFTIINP